MQIQSQKEFDVVVDGEVDVVQIHKQVSQAK